MMIKHLGVAVLAAGAMMTNAADWPNWRGPLYNGSSPDETNLPVKFSKTENIKWVVGHLGGAVPYLAERFDRGFEAYPACREHCTIRPSEQLRRLFYDTVNFDPACLDLAIEFAGVDHIVAGSDYPHQVGSIDKMKSSIAGLDISEDDREKILGGNASRILGLA